MPSPYSNSLKPTIIVTGILVTDRRFDLFQLKANRGDRIATRQKVLARDIAIMAPKLAGDGNRTSLLLDSRVVEWSMAYNLTFVILSSLNPLFFNSLKHELRFSGHVGAEDPGIQ